MLEKVIRKALDIKFSGRSTDYITPSFIMGCGFECSYCYCKRHKTTGISVAKNTGDILTAVNNHAYFYADVEKPNQTHPIYISYDIGCNSDMALHLKHYEWERVFEFFRNHPIAMASFATKYVNINLLKFDPKYKVRIRFSLMPQNLSDILEPNTSKIIDRIKAIDEFIESGYDVHVNFSPVVIYNNWQEDYEELFQMLDHYVDYKELVKAEVIFLTHNEKKHLYNLENNIPGEELMWTPEIQEVKTSQYGGKNVRYRYDLKAEYIKDFINLHDKIIPWNTIRYIF